MQTKPSAFADSYATQGYIVVENLLTNEEVEVLRKRTQDIIEGRTDYPASDIELEPGANGTVRKLNQCTANDPVYRAHASNEKILAIVESLIGPDIKLFGSQAFLKPPGGIEKPYHQDSAYFPIEPMSLVTCWAALDDTTIENGCMWVIPGSHQQGVLNHSELWMIGERRDMRIPESELGDAKEEPIVMKAGSCSFHHSLLLHSSRPNLTPNPRRGLAVHYMSAHSRWTDSSQAEPDSPLLRGRADYG